MNMEQLIEAVENYRDTTLTRTHNRGGWSKKRLELMPVYRTLNGPCWLVTSHEVQTHGYPQMWVHGKFVLIHKIVAEIVTGEEVPKGMTVSHLCELRDDIGSRRCVNPRHLVVESQWDNTSRSPNRTRDSKGRFSKAND